jgi:hypothetical protein
VCREHHFISSNKKVINEILCNSDTNGTFPMNERAYARLNGEFYGTVTKTVTLVFVLVTMTMGFI